MHQAVLNQVRAAATGQEPVPPMSPWSWRSPGRAACWSRVTPDRSARNQAKKQIARATADTPFAPGVAQIVDELIAAVAAAAATIAASRGSFASPGPP
jgi:hypothetical protein